MLINEDFELALELLLLCAVRLRWRGQARHILNDHQADLIAGLIKESRLNLDLFSQLGHLNHDLELIQLTYVFADSIEAKLLKCLEVEDHGFAAGWSIQPIRPKALVQCTKQECEFAIQQRPGDTVDLTFCDASETDVRVHNIFAHRDSEVVQVGGVGRPKFNTRNLDAEHLV